MNIKILSWAGYDLANTIFSMNVVSRYFPIMAIGILGATDLAIGVSRSTAMVLVALTMPVLGTLADQRANRKLPMMLFTVACCLITAFLGRSRLLIAELVMFGAAIYCYQSALVFYNALLPSVAPPGRMSYVSGLGVSLGYVGSIIGLFLVAVLSAKTFSPYMWTAILFFAFSLPAFIWVKDQARGPGQAAVSQYQKGLVASLKRAKEIPGLLRFLLARFFVVEAMETVILFMSVYLVQAAGFRQNGRGSIGLDEITAYLIVVTFFTVVGSYVWGIMSEKYGPKRMLLAAVLTWLVAFTGFAFLADRILLYIWGIVAGIGLGGVWTADRPLLINLVGDPSRLGEFFGLYALSGRLAAVIGPIIWGVVVLLAASSGAFKYKLAVEALFVMMAAGFAILWKVPDAR